MPVFTCRIAIALNVTNQLRISLAGCIETKRSLNLIVLQVTVDSLGTTDYLYTTLLGSIVLSQYAGIGIRVVTADDNNSLDVQLADNLQTLVKLVGLLQLGTARTNHIETTSIAVVVDEVGCNLHIVMVNQATRTHEETIKAVGWVQLLQCIKKTTNDIVTARSLTATEDNTHVHLGVVSLVTRYELYERHTISVREELLDFFLIVYTLSRSTFFHFYVAL